LEVVLLKELRNSPVSGRRCDRKADEEENEENEEANDEEAEAE
jgi:hypothetical protein